MQLLNKKNKTKPLNYKSSKGAAGVLHLLGHPRVLHQTSELVMNSGTNTSDLTGE